LVVFCDEHNRLNQELATLAAQKRVALPRMLDARAQFCVQSLQRASREHFDKCYAKAQLLAHAEAVAAFEAEAERGQDRDMRAWAARELPRIKEHLHTIKPMAMKFEEGKEKKEKESEPSKTGK
jgi:putative membrane protein